MYETRHQAAMHQDENKHSIVGVEIKAGAKGAVAAYVKAVNVKAAANNRRALGDIGNVVGGQQNGIPDGLQIAKKALPQASRPITRSFGAQLANKKASVEISHKACNVETKVDDEGGYPACTKALLDNQNAKVTAALKERRGRTLTATLTARSEAACGQIHEKVPELPNIDAGDVGNQLAVIDYIEDIYNFYRKTEVQSCVPPDYMSKQASINQNMRSILVDWLIEVHLKFKLMPETLFLTTNVMDRYLAIESVERKNLQLVGMTAMLIASKYEEIYAPEIQDFIYISDKTYTREQILNMEKTMLNMLKFNLCVPTPYMFLVRFLKAATSDQKMEKAATSDQKMETLAFYFVELCLVDYEMVKFSPSMLAAAALYTAHCTLKAKDCWSRLLRHHSGYSDTELRECATKMVSLHERAGEGDLTVVNRKYSSEKFGCVAHLKAPTLP